MGFNAYFIQFREAYTFFDRWYTHLENPTKPAEPFRWSRRASSWPSAVREIKRRDLLYHAVGHGWTCEPFGIPGLGWEQRQEQSCREDVTPYLAEVNGERALWQGIPLNTNLCYSNPEVRRIIVSEHRRLRRRSTRTSTCCTFGWRMARTTSASAPSAARRRPADFYVQMLNELDAGC